MGKFAEYIPGPERLGQRPSIEDLSIRPALESDLRELSEITAQREGDDVERWRSSFEGFHGHCGESERAVLLLAARPGMILGYGRARHFTPPEDVPPHVAPEGWYSAGVVVRPEFRRQGIGMRLTRERLAWIAQRSTCAYYFANARNRVSIELHRALGFVEKTRDFWFPDTQFEGGVGILFSCDLTETREDRSQP